MKKLLIFDVYGTLISTGTSSVDSCEKILSLQDQNIDPKVFYAKLKKLHRNRINKCIENNEFMCEWDIFVEDLKELYEEYNINRPYKEDINILLKAQFNRKVFEDTVETINKLKEKYRVVIGSTADTFPLIVNMIHNNLTVDKVYTSELIKTYKPDIKFYKYILDSENVDPKDACFIGDSTLDDILGPKKLNITTILIYRSDNYKEEKVKPDYTIKSLKELLVMDL